MSFSPGDSWNTTVYSSADFRCCLSCRDGVSRREILVYERKSVESDLWTRVDKVIIEKPIDKRNNESNGLCGVQRLGLSSFKTGGQLSFIVSSSRGRANKEIWEMWDARDGLKRRG